MTTQEVLELVRAGYTKAEIDVMNQTAADNQNASDEQAANQTAAEDQVAGDQTVDQRFAAINTTLDKMIQTMQRMAIRDSKQPENTSRTPEQVLEDVANMYK